MAEEHDPVYSLFHITEDGLKVIVVLIFLVIILGLIAAFTWYRKNLTGGRIMAAGMTLIAFSVVVEYEPTINFRMPALSFYLVLLGLIVLFVGLCWRNIGNEAGR
ncbi:hypothetical protein B9G55_05060 [Saccharibacillus sp. O16]|nr:hypothetical protein B9G55_05060 [Saccharibacillus sp. O16]